MHTVSLNGLAGQEDDEREPVPLFLYPRTTRFAERQDCQGGLRAGLGLGNVWLTVMDARYGTAFVCIGKARSSRQHAVSLLHAYEDLIRSSKKSRLTQSHSFSGPCRLKTVRGQPKQMMLS